MKLKRVYDKQADIPTGMEALFEERDGKFVFVGLEGLKTDEDVQRVQTALDKERKDHNELKKTAKKFEGIDPDAVHAMTEELEALKAESDKDKPADQKIDQLVEARVKRRLGPIERERDTLKATVAELTDKVQGQDKTIKGTKIASAIRDAAAELKVVPHAIEDVILLGERTLVVGDDGKIVTGDGAPTPGIDAKLWLKDMQKARPHWWPVSEGGGAGGDRGGGKGDANPWKSDQWNLTAQGSFIREKGMAAAETAAAAAGTKVGGPKPAPAKAA